MKKLIGLLAATGLIAGAGATAVSCGCGKAAANKAEKDAFDALLAKDYKVKVKEGAKADEIIAKAQADIKENLAKSTNEKVKVATFGTKKPEGTEAKKDAVVIVVKVANDNKKVTVEGFIGVENKKDKEKVDVVELGKKTVNVEFKKENGDNDPTKDAIDLSKETSITGLTFEAAQKIEVAKKAITEAMSKLATKPVLDTDYTIDFSAVTNQDALKAGNIQVKAKDKNAKVKGTATIVVKAKKA